jgi:pimeloyl-ACP methyl ester carboxylesterase
MGTAQDFLELAESLAADFTVYVPDRRGRGISGPTGSNYSIQKEVEDIDALLTKTDTHNVFGLSSGGLISLTAALTLRAIHKLAAFDPVIYLDGLPIAKIQRFNKEMAEGKIAAALITAMQAARLGPPIFDYMPRWLLERLTGMMLAQQDKKGAGDYATMRQLAQQTLPNDLKIVAEMDGKMESFRAIKSQVLLLGGNKSPQFLRSALDALEHILPNATRIEFDKLGHEGPWNADKRGQAKQVAQALRQYFLND